MYGFCRYIKVLNTKNLFDSLCKVWIGKLRLHANVARFSRKDVASSPKKDVRVSKPNIRGASSYVRKDSFSCKVNSYANVAKGSADNGGLGAKTGNIPSSTINQVQSNVKELVLDDTCFNQCDVSSALMGKVKECGSLSNLKMVLANKGFDNIKLKYMGGFWVMIEFLSEVSKENFKANVDVNSWFSHLQQASNLLHVDERVTWVDIIEMIYDLHRYLLLYFDCGGLDEI
ncbi:nucleotide-binding alpha-beta plait domain-containing protein [Artemisia annua]|uniref:Nucleotide-binding alpha-beta plait domain-containing protein n=1 Tax=Artemisia annua TaxID=35608 RepID=A0A2U1NFW7_ARTAN|nr:nucleotide-binding alpha-beta plait domain-containing protein [Artemisia annua]